MNGLFRIAALLIFLGTLAVAAPGMAAAQAGLGLRISAEKAEFGPADPVRLTFTVTNPGDAACDIATSATGTVRVISLRRDGQELRPELARSYYIDGIRGEIATSLRTVEPGSSVQVEVTGLRMSEGAGVISSVTAAPDGSGLDALWPVGEPGRYELTATYAVPDVDGGCSGSTDAVTVAFTVREEDEGLPTWLLAGGVALAVLALGGIVAVLVRRRAGRTAAGAVVLLMISGVALAGPNPMAEAELVIEPSGGEFENRVRNCVNLFREVAAGPQPVAPAVKAVLDTLNDPDTLVRVLPTTGWSHVRAFRGKRNGRRVTAVIFWHPTSRAPLPGEPSVKNDPCSALYHEASHVDDYARGTWEEGMCGNTGIPKSEVKGTLAENAFRAAVGQDVRTKYYLGPDNVGTLPRSYEECEEEPRKPPPEGVCGDVDGQRCAGSYGDPHLMTFDQLHYEFQAVGEFVNVRGDGLEMQARHEPFPGGSRAVSVTSAVAFWVGESRLNLVLDRNDIIVRIDGAEVDPDRGERALPGGGALVRQVSSTGFGADTYVVRWPDGSAAEVETFGSWGLRLVMKLDRGRIGAVEGLYGDFDGDPLDDLTPATGGDSLGAEPEFEPLYRVFGDSWRVRGDTSLFDYAPGESTETFTDRSFPDEEVTLDDLDPTQRAEAEWICREAGVTAPTMFADCVLDVAVTGQPDFAVASAGAEQAAPPAHPITAPTIAKDTLVIDRAGEADRLTFNGKAGQEVFVDLSASTLPDECGSVRLLGPAGTPLPAGGCVTDGTGRLDRTELPETGEYTVELAPAEPATGRLLVRVYEMADKTGTITPDGRTETVAITHPGSVGRLTFTGRAGQTVFVDAPRSNLPDDRCGVLRLLGPDGRQLNTGCVVDGEGHVDTTTLAADGRHTVLVDPGDSSVGETELRLVVTHDQTGSIAMDGSPVRATVRQPGAVSAFEFRGRAGQRIRLDVSEGTLPDQCGVVAVVGPGDRRVRVGCVISGTGTIDEVRLPADGVYRVVVDPRARGTGGVTLRLTG